MPARFPAGGTPGPARDPGRATEAATTRLAPRLSAWPYLAAATPLLAAVAAATTDLTGASTAAAVLAALLAIVAGGWLTAATCRGHHRGLLMDNTVEGLWRLLEARAPARSLVTTRAWTGGLIGHPRTVTVRYAKHLDGDAPGFVTAITTVLTRELGHPYTGTSHHAHGKWWRFTATTPGTTDDPPSPRTARLLALVHDLLGATATVRVDEDPAGQITGVRIHHQQPAAMALPARRQRVERAMATKLPGGRWTAQWDLAGDEVYFRPRPVLPALIRHPEVHEPVLDDHRTYQRTAISYAVDEDGHEVVWRPAVHAHLLVIGGTGSGKTVLEHGITQRLAQAGWRIWIIDGKRIEFIGFRHWPNVELIGSRIEHQIRMIFAAHELMEARYAAKETGRARIEEWAPLLLVVDELTTVLKSTERFYRATKPKGAPAKPPVLDLLADLLRLGRSAKIHVLAGLQRPDVEFLGGEMRDNFGARVSLGRLSPQGALMMWGSPGIGVTVPRTAQGRGIGIGEDGHPVEIQAYYAPNPDPTAPDHDPATVTATRPTTTTHRPLRITELPAEHDGSAPEPTFDDYASAPIVPAGSLPASPPTPTPTLAANNAEHIPATPNTAHHDPPGPDQHPANYGPASPLPVGHLSEGDLILLNPPTSTWAVVDTLTENPRQDTCRLIDYRTYRTGEPHTISLEADTILLTRHPTR